MQTPASAFNSLCPFLVRAHHILHAQAHEPLPPFDSPMNEMDHSTDMRCSRCPFRCLRMMTFMLFDASTDVYRLLVSESLRVEY